MRGRYPDQVGRHKPCVPVAGTEISCPRLGRLIVLSTTVVVVSLVDTGHLGLAQWGVSRSGRESVMAVDRFCRNAVGPPEWECEAMGSVVWVQCATSAECIIYR